MVTTKSEQPVRIERVRRRLERWREHRAHPKSRMAERLWRAVVAVARQDGLYRTARALDLDYGAVRRHVQAREAAGASPGSRCRISPRWVGCSPTRCRGGVVGQGRRSTQAYR